MTDPSELVAGLGKLNWHELSSVLYEAIKPRIVKDEEDGERVKDVMLLAMARTYVEGDSKSRQTFLGYVPAPYKYKEEPDLSEVGRSDDFFEDGVCDHCIDLNQGGSKLHFTYSLKKGVCPVCENTVLLT